MSGEQHTWTHERRANSYFNGSDVVVLRDGKHAFATQLKEDDPAIYVKHGYKFGTDATRALRDELPEERFDAIVEQLCEEFWENLAPELAREHGFEDVWQHGYSGGWLSPTPGEDAIVSELESWFTGETPLTGEGMEYALRFCEFACAITELVEEQRTSAFDERVRDEHADWLVEKAARAVEDSRRFALFMGDEDVDRETGRDANSWDHDLTRSAMIALVNQALRSTDAGTLVIRVSVTKTN